MNRTNLSLRTGGLIAALAFALVAACGGDLTATTTQPPAGTDAPSGTTGTTVAPGATTQPDTSEPRQLDVEIESILGFEGFGLAVDGTTIWMTDRENGVIRSVDTTTGEVSPDIPVGRDPVGIAAEGGEVWVANSNAGDHTVMKIDAATGGVLATVETPAGTGPTGVALTENHAWVGLGVRGGVAQIDRASGELVQIVATEEGSGSPGDRIDVVAAGDTVWSIDRWCGRVLRIDATTGDIVSIHDDLGYSSSEPDCLGSVEADGPLRIAAFEGGIFVFADVVVEDVGHVRRISRIDIATDEIQTVIDIALRPTLAGQIGQPGFVVADRAIWFTMGNYSARMDRDTGRVDFVVYDPDFTVVAFAEVGDTMWHAVTDRDGDSGLYGVDRAEADAAAGG
ncbi:MAG TPA: hypothetical protein VK960_04910 [Acidimicrobiia bacterium]|nr:hypothetical protein [Acidimicrobiia bacterium]